MYGCFNDEDVASSRRSVSQGAVQKIAREKKIKKSGARGSAVFCTAPWLTERLEEANEDDDKTTVWKDMLMISFALLLIP